jgi:uncharacterized membrane protein YbhN (UPF0104 family)/tRNA A-37 threonylcarbamoyl transferase component Bud32
VTSQQTEPDVDRREDRSARLRAWAGRRSRTAAGIRVFSSSAQAPRARRPTDVLLLILSIGALVLFAVLYNAGSAEGGPLAHAITSLPGLFGWFWEISIDLLLVWAAVLLLVAALSRPPRLGLMRDQVLAAGAALLAGGIANWAVTGEWWTGLHTLWSSSPPPSFPAWRVVAAGAVIVTSSPHLSRSFRYVGRWVLGAGAFAAIAVETALPIGVAAGLAAAVLGAASVHLAFGSPGGQPTTEEMTRALDQLGVGAQDLERVGLERRGVALVRATDADGRGLIVRVYGRDAWDGQFLTALWSKLWYRNDAAAFTLNRQQQVEHEAFVTLLAERSGVPVLPLVAAGMSDDGDAVVVIEERGQPLDELHAGALTDDVLRETWVAVTRLHEAGIAHGRLDADHLLALPDGSVAIGELSGAAVTASSQDILADRAQVLVSTALPSDQDAAVRAARDALGPEGLAEILPFLQRAALSPQTRQQLESRDYLEGLRKKTADAAGVDVPKLQQLRRVTVGSLAMVLLIGAASYFIIAGIAGIGFDTIAKEFQNAEAGWIVGAFLLAPTVSVADAFVTMGATMQSLRLGPVVALQLAIRFVSLAVPTTAGRVAMNIRFFQKNGLPAASAVTIGALDGFSGFVVQVLLLLVISLSGAISLQDLVKKGSGSGLSWVLIVGVIAAIVVGVAIVLAVKRLRLWALARLREAREPLAVLKSPFKVFELLAGNFVAQVISAIVLSMTLRAFGYQLPLAVLLFINTAVSMFAGFMPVPGGIGVYEGALAGALTSAGIPSAAALSTALAYRLVTYYLPPIYGGIAMRWMRKHDYL